jgi:hypothetical protein
VDFQTIIGASRTRFFSNFLRTTSLTPTVPSSVGRRGRPPFSPLLATFEVGE